jgi:LPXTG-site transpeptidase (sortase) family protein
VTLYRGLGYAFFCMGGATFAFASGRYALGEWQRQDARRSWDEAEARATVALARRTASIQGRGLGSIAHGVPVARLLIPRLLMDEIVIEGVDDYALLAGPGHLPGSAYPGESGNSIISAHRDRHFASLGKIQLGDTLYTEAGTQRTTWVVISKRVIDADAPALFRTREATLTLTTCWPIRYLGTAPERLLVTAKPIAPTEQPSFADADAT